MAISEIQTDMNEGRFGMAKAKLQALADTWQRFDRGPDSFSGRGIGDVMVSLGAVGKRPLTNSVQWAKNGVHPF